jgi:sulfate adenylyltransferase
MNLADALSVAENMHTCDGRFFPVPLLNLVESVDAIEGAARIALRDPNVEGSPVIAIQQVDAIETVNDEQMALMTEKVYRTSDHEHPGVAAFNGHGRYAISGPIQVLNFSYFEIDFPDTFRTAVQIRDEIEQRGWQRVVAFQTRNPMHLAHEELCHMAMDRLDCDGLVIHMLLGKLKPGDIPADVRDNAIRTMVDLYFPENSAIVTGYGFDMLYAGPREAVLHAYFRPRSRRGGRLLRRFRCADHFR